MDVSNILIVDDNPEIREIIEILLTGEGFLTFQAKDGMTALKLLQEQDFDLIIMDIMMPGINGYQTCLEIRKSSNAPVLFLSARTKDSDKTLGFSSGGDDYLAKPFSYNELISRVKALIRRYHIYKEKTEKKEPLQTIQYHHLTVDEYSEQVSKDGISIEFINPIFHFAPPQGNEDLFDELLNEAVKYDIPKSEEDTDAIEKLQPFFNLTDCYTSIYIYGSDGYFRAGKYASAMDDSTFRTIFDLGYRVTGGEGEGFREFTLEFKNGSALVMLYFYHNTMFLYPYALFCSIISVLLFLIVILFFISQKMEQIFQIKNGILQMASGDLKTALPQYSKDEIGILSAELDKLRITLDDTLRQEQESRQANRDLITAMSHDLRTPLTILTGYLEVLKLKKSPDMQEEYLNRCLQKTKDIKEMTDRMFEYALIFEETETPSLEPLDFSFFHECLRENFEFIHLAGFACEEESPPADFQDTPYFTGDAKMIKRIFNNLFSNILKYGDKSEPVQICLTSDTQELKIILKNKIKAEHSDIESNHIGLRSVEKMMSLLNGRILYSEKNHEFAVQLTFSADASAS